MPDPIHALRQKSALTYPHRVHFCRADIALLLAEIDRLGRGRHVAFGFFPPRK